MWNRRVRAVSGGAGFPLGSEALSDRELLEQFAFGRGGIAEEAFATLVMRHGPMILGVCRQLLRDEHEAEDAFQVTFFVLARRARSIRRPELLAHWLYGVAVRTARKARALAERRLRREGREVTKVLEGPVGEPETHDMPLIGREEAEALHEEIGRLPEHYRTVVVLCYLEGLTHAEAARRLCWPVGTLSVRLSRARALLRGRLERRGFAAIAGLVATASLPETAEAAVPQALAQSTTHVALQLSTGPIVAAEGISASTAALAQAVLRSLSLAKAGAMTGFTLFLSGLLACAVVATPRGRADGAMPGGVNGSEAPALADSTPAAPAHGPVSPPTGTSRPEPVASIQALVSGGRTSSASSDAPQDAPRGLAGRLAAYHRLAAGAGRDADAHVALALWCEQKGLEAERVKHLAHATLLQSDHARARGLLGQVRDGSRWRPPRALVERARADTSLTANLAEYDDRRAKAGDSAEAHWKLALWCEQRGLRDEARAHLIAVTRREPGRDAAWLRLGYRRQNGRWQTDAEAETERAELDALRNAERRWKPLLTKWRGWLDDRSRRDEAERELAAVVDPHAVSSIWEVFGKGAGRDQARAVQLLGQINAPSATRLLTLLAIASPLAEVRRSASETLAHRDPRAALGILGALLRDPIPNMLVYRYQWIPTGALGIGSPGITLVEGRHANAIRFYTVDEGRIISPPPFQPAPMSGYPQRIATQSARQTNDLTATLRTLMLGAMNESAPTSASVHALNAHVIQTLRNITGTDRGNDWEEWKRWWVEEFGYAYEPERYRNPPDSTIFQPKPTFVSQAHLSCFAAGTPVQTLSGAVAIDLIRIGDRVLAQDPETGLLAFAMVVDVAHNNPSSTLRIGLGDTAVVATGIHQFWKVGRGWVMANDLMPADMVRTVGGSVRVTSVATDQVQPVFNLEVEGKHSFFVGEKAALVHDNSRVESVAHPFDDVADNATR